MEAFEAAQAGTFAAVPWYMMLCLGLVIFVAGTWVLELVWRWFNGR